MNQFQDIKPNRSQREGVWLEVPMERVDERRRQREKEIGRRSQETSAFRVRLIDN